MISYFWRMRNRLNCNLFAYDYSGFGMSSGSPSERNIYADIEAAVRELMLRKSLRMDEIILYGESIGSVATIYLASKYKFKGVIVQSSFMSGMRLYLPYAGSTLLFDPFANIERIGLITSKTLIIHGTEDMLANIEHALRLHKKLKNPVAPFWVAGASHMTGNRHPDYYERLKFFIRVELQS